jgi:uncharacterized integral membrane protein
MTEISIPDNEMNQFDLPRVDVVTGTTDGVVFKPVKFQWYPRWVAVFVVAPLLFIIVALVMMRRTKGELPFTEASYSAWRLGRVAQVLAIVGALLGFVAGAALLDRSGALGGLVMLASVAVPIVVALTLVQGKGPRVVRIAKGFTVLQVPSAAAAAAFQEHLTAGDVAGP